MDKSYWLIEANRLSAEAEIFRDWLIAVSPTSRNSQGV
jgi:LysR family glycine cleavage system transcriptional activator